MTLDLQMLSGIRHQNKRKTRKMNELDLVKMKHFYAAKDTMGGEEREATEWEREFINLMPGIYKEPHNSTSTSNLQIGRTPPCAACNTLQL